MTDEEFKSMFLSVGPLKSSKIVRDKTTGFSYGFGFVEYKLEKDAERAVKVFDGHHMHGKRIRVQPANKQEEHSRGHNLYVKNIPSTYTEKELDQLFEPYGKIVTSKVLMDLQTGQSRNVGFVLYDTKAEADKAISELNMTTPAGFSMPILLKFAEDNSKKMIAKSLQNVVPQVTQQFKQPFKSPTPQGNGYTSPTPPGPMRVQNTSRFRFNPMARDDGANCQNNTNQNMPSNNNNYFGNMNTNYTQGYGFNIGMNSGMSSPNLEIPQGSGPCSVFVFNIGDDAEERELWALFSPFGTIQKCTVMRDPEKKFSKGYGFVDMTNALEAANAIKNLNGYFYKGRQLNVSFKSKKKE